MKQGKNNSIYCRRFTNW